MNRLPFVPGFGSLRSQRGWPVRLAGPAVPLALAGVFAALPWLAREPAPWATLLVLAPIAEELVFRVGLQEALLRRWQGHGSAGTNLANAATAVVFAAAHIVARGDVVAAMTLLPALAIGWAYQKQRRVLPCIALHAIFNLIWIVWIRST